MNSIQWARVKVLPPTVARYRWTLFFFYFRENAMSLFFGWDLGLSYDRFLEASGNPVHARRWEVVFDETVLEPEQTTLLGSFTRKMQVLCLAGVWCGDCVEQCPIFRRFAEATAAIDLRFLDRDANPEFRNALSICGGNRIPVVVIFNEDGQEVARFGDRTLARYRHLARAQTGAACPTGVVAPPQDLQRVVVKEWLDVFERAQLLLRLSPRLRERYGD
ncbi:MAG: thioredoxin family protein [Planctomycetota bacterium]|nr:thioredoxin family protein [Planctomycetota bacterium]